MALADYFHKSAVAAAQVLAGHDEAAIANRLESVTVGIAITEQDASTSEGRSTLDLAVRLLARLYPSVTITGGIRSDAELQRLAVDVNPNISLNQTDPDITLVIGKAKSSSPSQICIGSCGWDAAVSTTAPQSVGKTQNPFGAGTAVCWSSRAAELLTSHTSHSSVEGAEGDSETERGQS